MADLEVRFESLEPMLVASFYGWGESPEEEAWRRLSGFAGPRGWLDDPEAHPRFGYNDPPPSPHRPRYGYELWIKADAGAEPGDGGRIHLFYGGPYAVARCTLSTITDTWIRLHGWAEERGYPHGWRPGLEKHLEGTADDPDGMVFDLYYPLLRMPEEA